jgi:hypothetical protein
MIKVVNKYSYKSKGEIEIDIMRGKSVLGNPFIMRDSSDSERDRVCDLYAEWLRAQYKKKGVVFQELNYIARLVEVGENVVLKCCCKPKRCHGDFIIQAINGINKNRS